ncbi:uncharacterized protein Z518_10801 [Rhinocladiella mackenziei CBS 650.93]|uniref:Probable cytosolic iron-sulfur protein assembly protein 1 n=1 Tax=Rhinocladiella mackenziei CBS 650.93 TaxID=1442369 RepID=A0A0D2I288_9EURO|nr:uncharacterized protein Z518_10801 [Rhinocladiella mackenziei CBS 650.93]KIW99873.1 hypothetical protein Z518_10801 [Rhinocladiella mackenziei CBS 650.93]
MAESSGLPPSLSLLTTLHPPASGPTRSWQSVPHPDPSTPLLATASADKTVHVWSLRDFSRVSTISGGHKRSVRAVAWKDFGTRSKRAKKDRKPVVLGTGSFDANVGIWVWNDDRRWARFRNQDNNSEEDGAQRQDASDEIDLTRDAAVDDEEDEEWHFSTLLTGPDSEIKSIDFSPPHYPANLLATSSRDKSVWIWEEVEPEEWETIAVLSEHTGDVKCVSWCAGARKSDGDSHARKAKRRKLENATGAASDGDVEMENAQAQANGTTTTPSQDEEDQHNSADEILGSRNILASGSYDDTIRLWRDVEEEGDWICVGVIDGHRGTVWDLTWEGHINYSVLDLSRSPGQEDTAIAQFESDWSPRIVSCSDDLSVRVWRRELSEAEKRKRAQSRPLAAAPMGFASSRLPSVIRPQSAMERWVEDATLPPVHVRSIYAVDWSRRTGLVVSCGGDGAIAVYKEVAAVNESVTSLSVDADVVMNGTTPQTRSEEDDTGIYKLHKSKWTLVALVQAAHDEYEINHVCWAARRDKDRRFDGEEVIISTGDDGDVRVWTLSEDIAGLETGDWHEIFQR